MDLFRPKATIKKQIPYGFVLCVEICVLDELLYYFNQTKDFEAE